jgi:hypothetical protein
VEFIGVDDGALFVAPLNAWRSGIGIDTIRSINLSNGNLS